MKNTIEKTPGFLRSMMRMLTRPGKKPKKHHEVQSESSFGSESKIIRMLSRIDPVMRYRVGIDIGHFSLKFVIIERFGGRNVLRDWWIKERKRGEYSDSIAELIEELGEKLIHLVGRWSYREVPISIAILGKRVLVKKMRMPVIPDKEIKKALLLKFENEIASLPEDIGFGYHISNVIDDDGKGGLEVTTAVARTELLEAVVTPFETAGFSHISVLASSMLLSNRMKSAEPSLIVDIGFEKTGVYIVSMENRYVYREIAMGGGSFTDSLTGRFSYSGGVLELTREEAEELKKKYGLSNERIEQDGNADEVYSYIPAILRPTVEKLLNEIRRTSEYLSSGSGRNPRKVLLAGGGSSLEGLSDFLEKGLGSEVRFLASEDIGMDGMGEVEKDVPVHELAYAVSSALWAGKNEALIHPAYRVRRLSRLEGKLFKYAALVLAAFIISYSTFTHNMISRFYANTVLISSSSVLAGSLGSEMEEIDRDRRYLETMKSILDSPLPEGSESVMVLKELSHIVPDYVLLTRLDLIPCGDSAEADIEFGTPNASMLVGDYGNDEEKAADGYTVVIDGVIKSEPLFLEAYLSKFNLILRNSGVFRRTKIISWEREEGKGLNQLKFSINCELGGTIEEM